MKHSNVFYIRQHDGTYKPCKTATGMRNPLGVDIFRYKGKAYDGKTGLSLCSEKELFSTMQNRCTSKEQYDAMVQPAIDQHGLTPRYTELDVRKEQLFPRDESRVLMRVIGSKTKHYFLKFDTLDNGIEIFLLQSDAAREAYEQSLYTPLNGWMVALERLSRKDIAYQQLSAPGFDLLQVLLKKFEAALADPQRWADPGLGDLFDRRAEADAHNQPIREAREEERRLDDAKREAANTARELQLEQAYWAAIAAAERKLIDGQVVAAADIDGRSLLLQLFRENNITLPLRTQGWVKSSLARIQRTGVNDSIYYRRGRDSTVIGGYILQLIRVLDEKYKGTGNCEGALTANEKTGLQQTHQGFHDNPNK